MTGVSRVGLAAVVLVVSGGGSEMPAAMPEPLAAVHEQASAGSVSFVVDGRAKRFDHLPDGDNNYTPLGSTIRALPSAGAREHLMVTFLSIDLRKLQYPIELPLPRGAAPAGDLRAAMATVGFGYIDENGRQWAGPGRIRIEAFRSDGFVEGTFLNVSLPHTEKKLANATLTDGKFRAQISAGW